VSGHGHFGEGWGLPGGHRWGLSHGHGQSDRPIPIRSIDYQDLASREAARDLVFLDELDRQAEIANRSIAEAWKRESHTQDVHDPQTWSLLQGALFAAIIVARILKPRDVRPYPPLTAKESLEVAELRGGRLRSLLEIDEDSGLFSVEVVRNSFEHFDERWRQDLWPEPKRSQTGTSATARR
jgi:hypothetical protein